MSSYTPQTGYGSCVVCQGRGGDLGGKLLPTEMLLGAPEPLPRLIRPHPNYYCGRRCEDTTNLEDELPIRGKNPTVVERRNGIPCSRFLSPGKHK